MCALGARGHVTLAEWPLLSGDFQPGLQGRSVHSKPEGHGLSVAAFVRGVRGVTCSPAHGWAKGWGRVHSEADQAARRDSGAGHQP